MMLALGVSGILLLVAAICWYAVRRPSHASRLGTTELPHDTRPVATAAPAVSGADVDTDILEDTDETANSGGRDLKPVGKLSLLGDLAAGIAHEINNPVAIMLEEAGWIEDLLGEEDFRDSQNLQEFKRALAQIKNQGARCKAIIQNLVSFGQKRSLKVGDVHVNDLVAEVVRSYEQKLRTGNVEIKTHFTEPLPDCRLSQSELQQVLTNLINNSLDAVDPEAGRVEVRTRCDDRDVMIDVSDNGHGIPKAHLDKIFDPFFTTKPVGKGTGLGLSICYGLVEKMGGDISVESQPGMGTTFHVRIPWQGHEERPRSATAPAEGELAEEETPPTAMVSAPTVVLLVDDEIPFVDALRKRLAKRGMQILTAFSGEEALRELQRKRDVDVVLLGVNMPGMGGIETLREIKAVRPLVEVILLSADTTIESAIEGIKLGALDYLVKPCDMTQLLDQIEKARRRKRRQEQKIMEVRIKEITSRRI
jgi:signal transduction histidine kinase/FixJ family two-component response regulator